MSRVDEMQVRQPPQVLPTLWMTGLPSSGKTTLAQHVHRALCAEGRRCEVIDGDELRDTICRDLGFSRRDRAEQGKRALLIARFLLLKEIIPIVAMISPFRETRALARAVIGKGFLEVFLDCPLETCKERDVKGLYRRAARGELKHLTGVDDEYEAPEHPDLIIRTGSETPEMSASRLLQHLGHQDPGWYGTGAASRGTSRRPEGKGTPHG